MTFIAFDYSLFKYVINARHFNINSNRHLYNMITISIKISFKPKPFYRVRVRNNLTVVMRTFRVNLSIVCRVQSELIGSHDKGFVYGQGRTP